MKTDFLPLANTAVNHAYKTDDTAILVVEGIKYQCAQRLIQLARRGRHLFNDRFEYIFDADPLLGADVQNFILYTAQQVVYLLRNGFDLSGRHIDLVEHGDNR